LDEGDMTVVNEDANNVKDTHLSKRFLISLVIGPACWLMPHQGVISTLLPQRLAELDPAHKIPLLLAFSSTAMVVALISNFILGALSDMTQSRFGKRTPWIVGCSALSCGVLFLVGTAPNVPMLFVYWCFYEVVVNGVASSMVAQMSDRVPLKWRGTASSAYAIGQTFGVQLGVLVASQFLSDIRLGIWVFALIAFVGGLVSAWLANEASATLMISANDNAFSWGRLISALKFPKISEAHDFYLSLIGKYVLFTSTGMIGNYMLYFIQDDLGLKGKRASSILSINAMIILVGGLIAGAAIGPISDRLRRTKSLIVGATLVIAAGAFVPLVFTTAAGLIAYSCIIGIVNGANSTLTQSLNLSVLPHPESAAKDLGIMNLANTLGGVSASVLGGTIISLLGYRAIFVVEAVLLLLSAFCVSRIKSAR
jgi:MFS family permease